MHGQCWRYEIDECSIALALAPMPDSTDTFFEDVLDLFDPNNNETTSTFLDHLGLPNVSSWTTNMPPITGAPTPPPTTGPGCTECTFWCGTDLLDRPCSVVIIALMVATGLAILYLLFIGARRCRRRRHYITMETAHEDASGRQIPAGKVSYVDPRPLMFTNGDIEYQLTAPRRTVGV